MVAEPGTSKATEPGTREATEPGTSKVTEPGTSKVTNQGLTVSHVLLLDWSPVLFVGCAVADSFVIASLMFIFLGGKNIFSTSVS